METFGQGFNAARGFVGGATNFFLFLKGSDQSFNAARGFVGGATMSDDAFAGNTSGVSMPHAALWVVQQI